MSRIYVDLDLATGREIALPERAAHHVRTVLRAARDSDVIVFNGRGGEYEARLTLVARDGVRALLGAHREPDTESRLDVTLVQSISRGERMDLTVQKAVELGVHRIVPVVSQRTVVRLDGAREEKRRQHWAGVIAHATEQCGRTTPPTLEPISALPAWLSAWRAAPGRGPGYLLHPRAPRNLAGAARPTGPLTLFAGPEGGFDSTEVELLEAHGATPVRLGPRTLRTETAALCALTVIQALWGDLAQAPDRRVSRGEGAGEPGPADGG